MSPLGPVTGTPLSSGAVAQVGQADGAAVRHVASLRAAKVAPMVDVPDSHRDLLDAKYAVLATIGPDSRPQVSAVWFLAEGDTVKISLNTTRQKVHNLRRNPACTVFILDLDNPLRYL